MNLDNNVLANPANWPLLLWLVIAVALLVGYGLGALLSGRRQGNARALELERELDSTRDEFEAYRQQVSGHFSDTSKHLRDLALQYRTVYEHLADGARTLCPDSAVRIEASTLAQDLLPASSYSDDGSMALADGDDTTASETKSDDAPAVVARSDDGLEAEDAAVADLAETSDFLESAASPPNPAPAKAEAPRSTTA